MKDSESKRSLANPILLETIDKLFEYNIGEYVDLPQVNTPLFLSRCDPS